METGVETLLDASRLRTYLAAHLSAPSTEAFAVRKHTAGYSNETFFVRWGEREYVLRRPPRGDLLPTSHDVGREYAALRGLWGTAARVPRPVLYCADPDVIGAPFYVMERVPGVVLREAPLPAALDTAAERRRVGEELVDALVELHSVPWQGTALAQLGRAEGYLARQLRRWQGQIALTLPRTRALPAFATVGAWLEAHLPSQRETTVVHGDYKLDNVLFAETAPARLVAILDWEMATLGDPLADVGWLVQAWGPSGDAAVDARAVTCQAGMLSREELVARYAARSGRTMEGLAYYVVLAVWKLAAICEGLYALYLEGRAANPRASEMEATVPRLLERALRLIDEGDAAI